MNVFALNKSYPTESNCGPTILSSERRSRSRSPITRIIHPIERDRASISRPGTPPREGIAFVLRTIRLQLRPVSRANTSLLGIRVSRPSLRMPLKVSRGRSENLSLGPNRR